jgi:hypothetical protein
MTLGSWHGTLWCHGAYGHLIGLLIAPLFICTECTNGLVQDPFGYNSGVASLVQVYIISRAIIAITIRITIRITIGFRFATRFAFGFWDNII